MPSRQGVYFIITVPYEKYEKPIELPRGFRYISGQGEIGASGYHHWQIICAFEQKKTLTGAKSYFAPEAHLEFTRSRCARDYCHKEETRIPDSSFEFGTYPTRVNNKQDWDLVLEKAKKGQFDLIDGDVMMRHYNNIRKIYSDFQKPVKREVQVVNVYWGQTGTGKTKSVFEEIGDDFYVKMPSTKWFDGYRGQENVVIDEFTGQVDITHLLRWLDQYPCTVEVKGSQVFLNTKKWWITSNIDPAKWYEGKDEEQIKALKRRFTNVVHYLKPFKK
ncbi:replication-associated protein [Avon-Heathcote Estuary associated circular virus 26]|uniref:replication-associated protein n=1 Tax=Avon-Heathcote Estuary associated circular virus 26 TaxID=1618250 RepID=UPI0005CD0B25|nr:replication-associated protein [Avon-Heathcote Estuary associated circular virus 26]AJP36469.1 replication-associated protein [Avon-Heathcote Estuary associated circular virus 26]